ncbi:MAG: bifunctional diaminohydroxyphosphoribosylaminopyrimidine deaminase/5-amino-6-(5-phosphoribosylamino)uracil reductase RibD [Terriglobales bacterium]|jgi:diaminohydroxyphosphoribosylaminopyrimidine deaminase/5-amino-6-(5-phosphoribosylamino)uracil reductase
MTLDEQFMERAIELARSSVGLASPNPVVGAIIERGGEIIGEGSHSYAERKHAEILALEAASATSGERVPGATMYLNLEPCCHQGRTGPCTEAIISAGIKRVVAAMYDPNPLVRGKGFDRLREAGIEVATGVGEREARKLNEAFANWIRTRRPLVTLKSALTLDGKIGKKQSLARKELDDWRWITGEPARANVQELRHVTDALLVGVGTVIADDPLLTDRSGKPRRRRLLRVVLDSALRLPLESRLVRSVQDDLVVFCSSNNRDSRHELETRGIRVEQISVGGEGVNFHEVITQLGEMENLSVLIEGGSRINGAALAANVVDKLFLYFAPRLLGERGSVPFSSGMGNSYPPSGLRLLKTAMYHFGEDFALEGYLKDPYAAPAEAEPTPSV